MLRPIRVNSLDQRQLEQVIQAITEEIVAYLGGPKSQGLAGLEIDELVCPGCNQSCIEKCALKTCRVIDAGADRISAGSTVCHVDPDVAHLIDHTLLKPDASREEIRKICQEAVKFGFASVVVNPWYVPLAAEQVRGSRVKVCTVAGFPLGATLPQVKILETEEVIKLGAQEVDMVINVGALKSGQDDVVESDVRGVVDACRRAGADFVKTSTGFGPGGATAEDVALMRAVVGREIGVKAAGGVRTFDDLKKMVCAGATRIGASASVKILEQALQGAATPLAPQQPAAAKAY